MQRLLRPASHDFCDDSFRILVDCFGNGASQIQAKRMITLSSNASTPAPGQYEPKQARNASRAEGSTRMLRRYSPRVCARSLEHSASRCQTQRCIESPRTLVCHSHSER
eukprot:2713602-Pleurochrysis_carterae.AAC.4